MATAYSTEQYRSDGKPLPNLPRIPECGHISVGFQASVAVTELAAPDDRTYICPIPHRGNYQRITLDATDMDTNGSPTLVGSLVARNPDDDVETTLVALSPTATIADQLYSFKVTLGGNTAGYYDLIFKVGTAAATAAAGTITGMIDGTRDNI